MTYARFYVRTTQSLFFLAPPSFVADRQGPAGGALQKRIEKVCVLQVTALEHFAIDVPLVTTHGLCFVLRMKNYHIMQ